MASGTVFWKRWPMYYPNNQLMSWSENENDPQWHATNQGDVGNCYFI